MREYELKEAYFQWMCQLVCARRKSKVLSYQKLLRHLHETDFRYSFPMDGNRADDGIDLRYRFSDEDAIHGAMVAKYLDDKPCSVLEMMVALAVRCEEHIMDDPDVGDRTGKWFWGMISSLGLDGMTDSHFNPARVDDILARFLDRQYERDGEGGLFTIPYCDQDLRTIEIWYQMCWYLDDCILHI